MDSVQLFKAESIFHELVARDGEQRAVLLATQCAGDAELRCLVEQLLSNDDSGMDGFLREPAYAQPDGGSQPRSPAIPHRIGKYEIVSVLGEGGMGIVYEARQEDPRRTVALKVIRTALPSRETFRRFRHEAEILAQLQHPGIAHVYEAGFASIGPDDDLQVELPYFAMELVRGKPFREFAYDRRLSIHGRLSLMAQVCDAVQHAHEKGVIHRDLKADNLLIEGSGQPRILDFGVARLITPVGDTATRHTRAGEIIGTLAYMSPEQVSGDSSRVDTRSDVYSLGVILYELLAGHLPHDLRNLPLAEAARRIREVEPPGLASVQRAFRGDVQTIVSRAMHKDRARRYESPAALASDIRRHVRHEAIDARRDSAAYVLLRSAQRYRWPLAAGCAFVLGLAGFAAYAWTQAESNRELAARERTAREVAQGAQAQADAARIDADRQRDAQAVQRLAAQRETTRALAVTDFLVEMLGLADPDAAQSGSMTYEQFLTRAATQMNDAFGQDPESEARLRTEIGRMHAARGEPEAARVQLERAYEIRSAIMPDRADALYEIAWPLSHVLCDLSDTLAVNRLESCQAIGQRSLEQFCPELAGCAGRLWKLTSQRYNAPQAAAERAELARVAHASLGPEDSAWLLIGDQLYLCGYILGTRQHAQPSCDYLRHALEIYRERLPETNARIVLTLGQLIALELATERHAEAEVLARDSVNLLLRTLAQDHWYVALFRARHGACLIGLGRFEEAESLLLDGYRDVVAARGKAGRYAGEILRGLIRLHDEMGQAERAEEYRIALAAALAGSPEQVSWSVTAPAANSAREVFGPRLAQLVETLDELATQSPTLGPEHLASIFERRHELVPDEHPIAAIVAELLQSWGRYRLRDGDRDRIGLAMLEEAARIARASPVLYGRKKADVWAWQGLANTSAGSLAAAERAFRNALAILEAGFGTYAYTEWVQVKLGTCLRQQKRFEEAEPLLIAGYRGLLNFGGPLNGNTQNALHDVLLLYEGWGRQDQYFAYAIQDLDNIRGLPGADAGALQRTSWRLVRYAGLPADVYARALDVARRAIALAPDLDSAKLAFGAAQYRNGHYAEAISILEPMDADGTRHAARWALIALAHERLGQTEAARLALQRHADVPGGPRRASADAVRLGKEAAAMQTPR